MAPTKMKLRVRKKPSASTKSSQQLAPRPETSPDSKCPICLDRFVNVASVERCLHRFCFRCIREWARNKAECPLCKQPFRSIFHSVRAENDFKEYVVLESSAESATTSNPATVTTSTATVVTPPAAPYDPINSTSRTRRSRATRTRGRRSQTAQDSTASGSTVNEVALQRLLPWLQRDRVMGGTPNELHPFLLARTLHELMSFARSIEAMQCPPAPSYEEDSGSQSSIINISEDDDGEEVGITENIQVESVSTVPIATGSEISLSQSAWDDETPGPSYSTLSQLPTEPGESLSGGTAVASTEQRERNGVEDEEDEDECMIVGYVKPMAERTPELVQLSSDSTEGEGEGNDPVTVKTQDVTKVEPSHALPSPKSYPSTSQTENLPSQQRTAEAPRGRGFRTHSASDSSLQSGISGKASLNRTRERKRRGQRALGGSSSSSSEDLETSFPLWDSPERQKSRDDKKRKRRIKRRDRNKERSRSPHHHGNQTLILRSSSSSSSSGADSRPEKPAGKRKYKTRHLERNGQRQSAGRTRERSPSVEIIFEKRSSDAQSHAHRWRRSRHKKRSRRKARVQNSPSIITIDSDSDPKRAEGHGVDCQEPLTEDYLTDYKCSNNQNDHKDKLTAVIHPLTDSQDQSSGSTDPTSPPKGCSTQNTGQTVDLQDRATDCPAKVNYKHWVNADRLHGDCPEPEPGDENPPSDCKDHQPKHNGHSSRVDPGSGGHRHTTDPVDHGPNVNGSDCVEPTSGKSSRIADLLNSSLGRSGCSAERGGPGASGDGHRTDSIDRAAEENRRRADATPCLSVGERDGALTDSGTRVRAPSSEHKGPDAEISADTDSYFSSDEPLDSFKKSGTRLTEAPRSGKAGSQLDVFGVDQREGLVSHRDQSDATEEHEQTSGVQDDDDSSSDV